MKRCYLFCFLVSAALLCCCPEGAALHHAHTVQQVSCNSSTPVCECDPQYDVCEFNFTVSRIETFTRYYVNPETGIRSVHAHPWYIDEEGSLQPIPDHFSFACGNEDTPIGDTTCTDPITVDGYTFRYVIVVNNRLPGPTLIVNQNQLVKVNVFNSLFTESISLHFHGMLQKNTNWMDGAGGLTQCSILPYMSFTYIFNATVYGTHWYHSHSGTQRTEGLYGAFIVKQNTDSQGKAEEKILEKTGLSAFQDMPSEHTLMFSDWFKTGILAEVFTKTRSGLRSYIYADEALTPDTEKIPTNQQTPDGSAISYVPFLSGLINGKGRHESVDYIRTRLSIFTVSPDNVYRFRFIGAQSFYSYRVSIDEHKLTVIAADGEWIEPVTVDYLMVFSGERYDVLVQADQTSKDNFIIRAETLEIDITSSERYFLGEHYAEAILHYDRSPLPTSDQYESISNDSIPVSTRCTADSPCLTLNCPFTKFPISYNATCMNIHELRLLFPIEDNDDDLPNASEVTDSDRIFLNFNFEGSRASSAVNGRHFIPPSKPFVLLNDTEISDFQQREFCKNLDDAEACSSAESGSKDCVCPHVRTIPGGRTIQMVITNVASTNMIWFESHPIHLHGHHFHVVDVQYGNYGDDGLRTSGAEGIDCGDGPFSCTNPKWKDSDPYADLGKINSSPLKDTIVVPGGGYAVVYFKSNNPGWWLMACHVLDHFFEGMGVMIYETGDTVSPPAELQQCGNFDFTVAQYEDTLNPSDDPPTESSSFKFVVNIVLILAMVAMAFVSI